MTPQRRRLRYAVLVALPFIAVYLFHERLITNHDPGNFLAAIELGFDAMAERPHVPGYPFFVLLWQGLTAVGLTAEQAILASNALWCSIGLVALYRLALKFTTENAAHLAALFAALNPLVLFYAATGETYTYDLAFSSCLVLALMSVKQERYKWVWLVVGIAGGFRLSSIVFMYPVMLTISILNKASIRSIAVDHASLLVGVLLWLVPFTLYHGGLEELAIISRATMELESTMLQSASGYFGAALWMVNFVFPLLFLVPKLFKRWPANKRWILLVWIVAPTLFFVFRFYAKGYIIITLPAVAILLASTLGLLEGWKQQLALIVFRIGGLAMFLAIPFMPPSIALESSNDLGDRIETAGLRSVSWFAPSFDHLAVRTKSMLEAELILENWTQPGDTVILNRSTGMWAHPRSLQYHVQDRHIVIPTSKELATDYYKLQKINQLPLLDMIPKSTALFLCDEQMVQFRPEIDSFELLYDGIYVSLYRVPTNDLHAFIRSSE